MKDESRIDALESGYYREGSSLRIQLILLFLFLQLPVFGKSYRFVGTNFPKIVEKSESGKVSGLGVEIVQLICKRLNVKATIHLYPLKRALEMIKSGDADVIIGPYRSQRRSKFIDYTSFHFYEDILRFYSLKDSHYSWTGEVSKLKGLKIGAIRGWSIGDRVEKNLSDFYLVRVNFIDQLFLMLSRHRLELVIMHERALSQFYTKDEISKNFKAHSPAIISNKGYFGFSKAIKHDDFKRQFESEFKKLEKEGVIRDLKKKYSLL